MILRHFRADALGSKMVKYAPLGVQMVIFWVGLHAVIRDLVTRCLVFQCTQPLRKAGSVGMQRTGLMHVGWWEGVLSVLPSASAKRASTAGDLAEESPVVSRPEVRRVDKPRPCREA